MVFVHLCRIFVYILVGLVNVAILMKGEVLVDSHVRGAFSMRMGKGRPCWFVRTIIFAFI